MGVGRTHNVVWKVWCSQQPKEWWRSGRAGGSQSDNRTAEWTPHRLWDCRWLQGPLPGANATGEAIAARVAIRPNDSDPASLMTVVPFKRLGIYLTWPFQAWATVCLEPVEKCQSKPVALNDCRQWGKIWIWLKAIVYVFNRALSEHLLCSFRALGSTSAVLVGPLSWFKVNLSDESMDPNLLTL